MVGRPVGEKRLYFGIACIVVLMVGVVLLVRRPAASPTNETVNTAARQSYAEYYDALWRQDSGQGSILMTSTLFIPPMITALGQDTQRSEVEEQLWNSLKKNTTTQIGVYITLDSVAGFVADADIKNSLSLEASPGLTFQLASYKPIIGAGSVVNANVAVVSQRGLAIFTADSTIDWSDLNQVALRSTGLGDQPVRQFVWTQVGSLSE